MLAVTIDALLAWAEKTKYKVSLQKETAQICLVIELQGHQFPLFIRIYEQGNLLQLLVFFPTPLSPGRVGDLARLLHLLNKEVDFPGFGMDERSKTCFYRVMLPCTEKKIEASLLGRAIKAIETVCEKLSPLVMTVAQGKATFEEILSKIQK